MKRDMHAQTKQRLRLRIRGAKAHQVNALIASKAGYSTKTAGMRVKWTVIKGPESRHELLEKMVNAQQNKNFFVLQFERSVLDEDAAMQSGIFTCHIDFRHYLSSEKQRVRRIKVLKQITSDEPWINSDWDSKAEAPEGGMPREEKRMLLE